MDGCGRLYGSRRGAGPTHARPRQTPRRRRRESDGGCGTPDGGESDDGCGTLGGGEHDGGDGSCLRHRVTVKSLVFPFPDGSRGRRRLRQARKRLRADVRSFISRNMILSYENVMGVTKHQPAALEYVELVVIAFLLLHFLLCRGEFATQELVHEPIREVIQDDFGQKFLCVDINSQPSLAHPLLQNHTIQMHPTSIQTGLSDDLQSNAIVDARISSVVCPLGTIPILRNYGGSKFGQQSTRIIEGLTWNGYHLNSHMALVITRQDTFYGFQATISVYQPRIGNGDEPRFSGALSYIYNGNPPKTSLLYAGWFVDSHFYGDDHVHFEVGWNDSGKFCTNLLCPGFVQVSNTVTPGAIITPVSIVNESQHQVTFQVIQDPATRNWWLTYGKDKHRVGYWPGTLFTYMTDYGSTVGWGGMVQGRPGEPLPPMGSGQVPEKGPKHAAFFQDIQVVVGGTSKERNFVAPGDLDLHGMASDPNCYQRCDQPLAMELNKVVIVCFLLLRTLVCDGVSTSQESDPKSVLKSEYGQIFRCVDVNLQQSLEHPLLKTHTIQMKPTSLPISSTGDLESFRNPETKIGSVACPSGTVPVLTNYRNSKSTQQPPRKTEENMSDENHFSPHTGMAAITGTFYGYHGTISVYQPEVGNGNEPRFSGAVAFLQSGEPPNTSSLYAGCVDPHFYGDNHAHLEVQWNDKGNVCTNLVCPGFVQVSNKIAPGVILDPVSVVNGTQYIITLEVHQDAQTRNWWLTYGKDKHEVGYWPGTLLSYTPDAATMIGWGGVVQSKPGEPLPPMGSGELPEKGHGQAAYIKEVQILVNRDNERVFLIPGADLQPHVADPSCYQVGPFGYSNEGVEFFFGGPGCPTS
ncbi:hypothetical protein ACP4OV_013230 [Aristida adscensionis]